MRIERVMAVSLLGWLLIPAALAGETGTRTTNAAAFEKLKTLVGTWQGRTDEGKDVSVVYELVSGGTVLMERFVDDSAPQYSNLITMYHMDLGDLALKHYCGAENQPRMNLSQASADGSTLRFDFAEATNLADVNDKHMYMVEYRFADDGRFTTEWTLRESGRDVYAEVVEFERVR